jgi:hypothetical protein
MHWYPHGYNCAVYLANFYLFTYEFDFIKHLLKSNTCPIVLHSLLLVRRFVDDLFVPNFLDFENFLYLNQDSFGSGIYPKTFQLRSRFVAFLFIRLFIFVSGLLSCPEIIL